MESLARQRYWMPALSRQKGKILIKVDKDLNKWNMFLKSLYGENETKKSS